MCSCEAVTVRSDSLPQRSMASDDVGLRALAASSERLMASVAILSNHEVGV